MWACLEAPSCNSKFARFERDSSRSYAKLILVKLVFWSFGFSDAASVRQTPEFEKTEFEPALQKQTETTKTIFPPGFLCCVL
jgi:hypothetical protein